jgi:acyl carrier protein
VSVDEVKEVLVETLGVQDRAASIAETTPLIGSLPELDSMAVLELITALERRFGITVEDEELNAELFETLGSLAAFVEGKRASQD